MKTSHLLILVAVVSLGIIGGVVWSQSNSGPGEYDEFAQCLADSGTTMYGSYRCPFCTKQKEAFGNSWRHVDYVECDLGTAGQSQLCVDQGIESYPTWVFGSGERVTGLQTLNALAEQSGCMLDGGEPTSESDSDAPSTTAPATDEETTLLDDESTPAQEETDDTPDATEDTDTTDEPVE